jgi:HSP20 family molecular chaperone IbpA
MMGLRKWIVCPQKENGMNQGCLELLDHVAPLRGFFSPLKETVTRDKDLGVSLYEDDDAVYLEVPVAGVKPEDILVTFDRRGVSIEGKGEEEKSGVKYLMKASRTFSRWIPLPPGRIDENAKVEALSKHGVLHLIFPKSRVAKPLKISVKSA